jgi:integrase
MNDMQTKSYLSDNFVAKIWPRYEMTLKKVRTRKSYFKYISDICNYLKKDFTAIDESEAQNYFSQLAETKSYEPKYLHLRLSACRSVASYIEKNAQHFNLKNYLSPFVFVDLPEYSDNIHKSDIPSIKQMNTVLSATEDDIMMFTIISICFRCALTVSEICNLKFSDVVEDDLGRLCFIVKGSKSPRVVKIPDDVKEILFRYVDQYPGEDFLFRNSKNQKLLTRTLQYRLRSIMDRADLSKTFTFQDIRNAAIIYMRQGGVTNADLVKYAGLSSEKWVSRFDGVIDGLDLAPCDYSHISIKY